MLDISGEAVSEVTGVLPALRTRVIMVGHGAPLRYQGAGRTVHIWNWIWKKAFVKFSFSFLILLSSTKDPRRDFEI